MSMIFTPFDPRKRGKKTTQARRTLWRKTFQIYWSLACTRHTPSRFAWELYQREKLE